MATRQVMIGMMAGLVALTGCAPSGDFSDSGEEIAPEQQALVGSVSPSWAEFNHTACNNWQSSSSPLSCLYSSGSNASLNGVVAYPNFPGCCRSGPTVYPGSDPYNCMEYFVRYMKTNTVYNYPNTPIRNGTRDVNAACVFYASDSHFQVYYPGSGYIPAPGDGIFWWPCSNPHASSCGTGHTAVVRGWDANAIYIIEQNKAGKTKGYDTNYDSLPWNGTDPGSYGGEYLHCVVHLIGTPAVCGGKAGRICPAGDFCYGTRCCNPDSCSPGCPC